MTEKDYLLIDNYEFKQDIGEGNFGKVKLGIFKKTGEEFAIKIINKDKIKKKMKNILFKENEIITKFNHINVVYVFQIIEEETDIYIVMEYCKNGELFDYIVSHQRLEEDEASVFFYQLINGVEYIHKMGVAHRDLKPENLLLTVDKTLKIIDFGLSHEYDENSLLKTKCGSPSYAAPELIKGKLYDGFKTDIWCCGIILYAMLCGYLPFEGDNNKELFSNILDCNPEYPPFLSNNAKNLIYNLLKINPDERLTIEQIKENDFYLKGKKLCKIDYKKIEDELEKRNTFYGSRITKFKSEKKKEIINNEKKIEQEETLSKISEKSNRNNKKINLINLITDSNNDIANSTFRQKILKKNYNFKKKIAQINDKIQKILQTDANESNNAKNQNNFNNLQKINLFNYKNNNIDKLIGKQNIYEERFQNKNTGYFLYLKKNNKNSINSIDKTASGSQNKTKKFFTQFVTPSPLSKKMISPFYNDYSRNYINKCKNTETINFDKHYNNLSLNNNSNDLKTLTINTNNIENSTILSNINKEKNRIYKTSSIDNSNKYTNYKNYSKESHKYFSFNKQSNNNLNSIQNNNIVSNRIINNINVIWENNSYCKNKLRTNSPTNKRIQKNDNYTQIQNMINKYNRDISKNEYNGIKTENNELINYNKSNISKSKNKIVCSNRNDSNSKENEDDNKLIKFVNYRSKSRDNGKNIIRNLKEKFINKNFLPPLDMHTKLNH